jgi:hypothetical protein
MQYVYNCKELFHAKVFISDESQFSGIDIQKNLRFTRGSYGCYPPVKLYVSSNTIVRVIVNTKYLP